MQFVGKVVSTVTEFYKDINPATLSGAIDVVVVEQPDKELNCSPFHVRFGKLQLLRPQEKVVEVRVNGEPTDLHMKVGEAGEAFFVVKSENPVPSEYATSPIPSPQSINQDEVDIEPLYLNDTNYQSQYENNEAEDYVSAQESDIDINDYPTEDLFKRQQYGKNIKKSILSDRIKNSPKELEFTDAYSDQSFEDIKQNFDLTRRPTYPIKEEPFKNMFHRKRYLNEEENEIFNYHSYSMNRNRYRVDYNNISSSYPKSKSDQISIDKRSLSRSNKKAKINPDPLPLKEEPLENQQKKYPISNENNEISSTNIQTEQPYVEDINKDKQWSWRWGSLPTEYKPQKYTTSEYKNNKSSFYSISNDLDYKYNSSSNNRPISYKEKIERYFASSVDSTDLQDASSVNINEFESLIGFMELIRNFDISVSTCKFSDLFKLGDDEAANELFEKNIITFEAFCKNPSILVRNDDMACRINKRYYSWKAAEILILSFLVFRKPLTSEVLEKISNEQNSRKHGFGWRQWWRRSNNTVNNNNVNNNNNNNNANNSNSAMSDNSTTVTLNSNNVTNVNKNNSELHHTENSLSINQETYENMLYDLLTPSSPEISTSKVENEGKPLMCSSPELSSPLIEEDEKKKDAENNNKLDMNEDDFDYYHYSKSLRLSSDQLKSLNLKKGVNTISFSVTTKLQGTATCVAKIYFWDMSTQIVISDVDGTITKSDALGHLFTFVGKDWTHSGVANLYTNIFRNGYQILYLTSRAIGQSNYTRGYLKKVEQGQYQLPDGPIIMSPDRLFKALHREMIIKKPEDFKIAALSDIKSLWKDRNPFYAGFGNRITDALSYKKVDVPTSRIFTIDPKGEVKLELLSGYKSTYGKLNDLVDQIFPPVNEQINSDFNDYNYWKSPFPDIEIDMSIIEDTNETEQIKNSEKSKKDKQKPKIKKELSKEKIIFSNVSDNEEKEKDREEQKLDIKFNNNNERKIVINDVLDGEIVSIDDQEKSKNRKHSINDKNSNRKGKNKSIKNDNEEENEEDNDNDDDGNDEGSGNSEDEELEGEDEYIDEQLSNDKSDFDIQVNKDEITAYIDDLLIEDDDPTEKLDLAAYPYL